jgi:hypothetical protein
MGVTSGYWQMWHIFSSGMVYCALGMPNIECTGGRWRSLLPHLPVRDRYAQAKLLQATVAFMEIRGEVKIPRVRSLAPPLFPVSALERPPADAGVRAYAIRLIAIACGPAQYGCSLNSNLTI